MVSVSQASSSASNAPAASAMTAHLRVGKAQVAWALRGASPPWARTSDTKSDTSCRERGSKAATARARAGRVGR